MPIYEYKCKDCGKITEILTGVIKSDNKFECNNCGGNNLEKMFSTPYLSKNTRPKGKTCCGKEERCETPPCSTGDCMKI